MTYFKRQSTTNPQTWNLSLVGDWNSWSNFGTSQSRTHGPAHEILTAGNTPNNSFSHDVKGNMTDIPSNILSPARKLFWDFDNQLTGVDTTGDSTPEVTYEYDVLHRRVARIEGSNSKVYIHSGNQIIADYNRGNTPGTAPVFRYVWGDYIDEPILRQSAAGTVLYFHRNQQYSTVALTNTSGEVVERYGYTAYGQLTVMNYLGNKRSWSDWSNRFLFTGREWDDTTKLFHFRGMWYDTVTGRSANRKSLWDEFIESEYFHIPDQAEDYSFRAELIRRRTVGDCSDGIEHSQQIKFVFSSNDGAPCDGFLVQRVVVKCYHKKKCLTLETCNFEPKQQPDLVFWELFPVEEGAMEAFWIDTVGISLAASALEGSDKCERMEFEGEVRYYCSKPPNQGGTGAILRFSPEKKAVELTHFGEKEGWQGKRVIYGGDCFFEPNTGNFTPSRSIAEPRFWKRQPKASLVKSHVLEISCCPALYCPSSLLRVPFLQPFPKEPVSEFTTK